MAWNTRWQIAFQDRLERLVSINIKENNWAGGVTTLTPSAEPFVTAEDDTEDIFNPVRGQTGYIRVIDETADGSLLEEIIPSSNIEKYVEVWRLSNIVWTGFVSAEAFSQDWTVAKKEVEIPVHSILGALKYINISLDYSNYRRNLAFLLWVAMSQVQAVTKIQPYNNLHVISNEQIPGQFLQTCFVLWSIFYERKEIHNGGDTVTEWIGNSLYDVLADVCTLFGLVLREAGTELYLVNYDARTDNSVALYTWSQVQEMGNSISQTPNITAVPDIPLVSSISLRSDSNNLSMQQGARSVAVDFDFETEGALNITIPQATEDNSQIYTVQCRWYRFYDDYTSQDANVQPHIPRTNETEKFYFWKYKYIGLTDTFKSDGVRYNWWQFSAASRYKDVRDHSVLFEDYRTYSPSKEIGNVNYVGAFPCRWAPVEDGKACTLTSGLFLSTNYRPSEKNGNIRMRPIYSIENQLGTTLKDGYLRLSFTIQTFETYVYHGLYPNDVILRRIPKGSKLFTSAAILFIISYTPAGSSTPSLYWDSGMTTHANQWNATRSVCSVDLLKGKPISNYVDTMNVPKKEDALYIPVTTEMTGRITVEILDFVSMDMDNSPTSAELPKCSVRNHILYDFELDFVQQDGSITASQRTSNHYYRKVILSGFQKEQVTDVKIGTFNNNMDSASFIADAAGNYIETLPYNNGAQRPESNLLDRMANFYCVARRIITPVIEEGLQLMTQRFFYHARTFFGIISQQRWRDSEQTVKFLEARGGDTADARAQSIYVEFSEEPASLSEIPENADSVQIIMGGEVEAPVEAIIHED